MLLREATCYSELAWLAPSPSLQAVLMHWAHVYLEWLGKQSSSSVYLNTRGEGRRGDHYQTTVYTHTHTRTHAHIHTSMYAHTHTHKHVCTHTQACMHTHTSMHTHTTTHTHTQTCMHAHNTHTHIHTYTLTCLTLSINIFRKLSLHVSLRPIRGCAIQLPWKHSYE